MNSIMNILISIFSPTIFWPIIGTISLGFIVVVIFSILQDTKTKKQDVGIARKLTELQEQLGTKEDEISRLKEQFKSKEADYNHQLTRLEEQITENETNRAKIKNLELQLKGKDEGEAALKERARCDELEEKLKNAQAEIDKAKKEASLKTDMYNGLKNQYDELEGQLTSQAKNADEAAQMIKKLEQELKEAKLKLLEALKHPKGATQEEKPPAQPEQGMSISKVYPAEIKPEIPKQEAADTPKQDSAKKQKAGIRPEAKVRLAQVMQEAAKVAIKKEEKEKSEQPEDKKPTTPEQPKSDNP
ncbi:MAG: hypothetical protein AB1629_04175 [Candidatus Omnitrophota bacterium]